MKTPEKNQRGIAMMVVLWVLVLLMALATEFAFSMKTEVNTTRNFKEDIEGYYLAKAGIALAMAEVLKPARFHSIHPEHGWISGNPVSPPSEKDSKGEEKKKNDYDIVPRTDIAFGNGSITYAISDENSRIPINTASRGVLIKALAVSGVELGEARDIIADSILDWIDADSNHRLNGAENDYYQNLRPPYKSKNGKFETIEELLKIRGMTEEILFGSSPTEGGTYKGLSKIFTVYNADPINLNTASADVLSILFNESQVQDILGKRKETGYYNESKSNLFRIESTGKISGSQTRHAIATVMGKTSGANGPGLLTYYWNDNYIEP